MGSGYPLFPMGAYCPPPIRSRSKMMLAGLNLVGILLNADVSIFQALSAEFTRVKGKKESPTCVNAYKEHHFFSFFASHSKTFSLAFSSQSISQNVLKVQICELTYLNAGRLPDLGNRGNEIDQGKIREK